MSLIVVGGEVDISNCHHLSDYIERHRRPGDHVVADLSELSFMDCYGLSGLMRSARRTADDACLHLAGARGVPARLLQLTRVGAHLPLHDTVEQAIRALSAVTCAKNS